MPVKRSTKEQDAYESEVGATSGQTHDKVLEQTLGHERGLRVATSDGPPMRPPRRGDAYMDEGDEER